ncbi:hypothetical protein ACFX15_003147 [Malus domestica]
MPCPSNAACTASMDARFDALEASFNARFSALEATMKATLWAQSEALQEHTTVVDTKMLLGFEQFHLELAIGGVGGSTSDPQWGSPHHFPDLPPSTDEPLRPPYREIYDDDGPPPRH